MANWRPRCQNDLTKHSFKTNKRVWSNFMSRPGRVTQLLPGQPHKSNQPSISASQVPCSPEHLFLGERFRCRWYAQTGRLLESNGKTLPPGSLVPPLEIPLASPSCAPAEPQKHVCDSRTTNMPIAFGLFSSSLGFRQRKASGNTVPSAKTLVSIVKIFWCVKKERLDPLGKESSALTFVNKNDKKVWGLNQ